MIQKTKGAFALAFAAALAFGCDRNIEEDPNRLNTDGYNNRVEGTTGSDAYGYDTTNLQTQPRTTDDAMGTGTGTMREGDDGMNEIRTAPQGTVTPGTGTTTTTPSPRTPPTSPEGTQPQTGTQTGTDVDGDVNQNPTLRINTGTDRYQNPQPGNPADTIGNTTP